MNKESNADILWQDNTHGLLDYVLGIFHLSCSQYQITNKELILKEGLFKRKTKIVSLRAVNSLNLIEGIIQRLLNIGNLYISINDGSAIVLKNIQNPEMVRKILNDATEKIESLIDI